MLRRPHVEGGLGQGALAGAGGGGGRHRAKLVDGGPWGRRAHGLAGQRCHWRHVLLIVVVVVIGNNLRKAQKVVRITFTSSNPATERTPAVYRTSCIGQ